MNAPDHQMPSLKDSIYQAFQRYSENPEAVAFIADQILGVATKAPKLNFTPTSSGKLSVTIGNDEAFEVGLPYDSVSSFRTLLTRFGIICGAAAEKRSLSGKVKVFLKRTGLIADKNVTERKGQMIEYVSAVVRDQPGSPLYKVDADLDIKQSNGMATPLHLTMQNDLQKLFLLIELRNLPLT